MKNVMERLNEAIKEKGPLLAGLDPDRLKIAELSSELTMEDFCFGCVLEVC